MDSASSSPKMRRTSRRSSTSIAGRKSAAGSADGDGVLQEEEEDVVALPLKRANVGGVAGSIAAILKQVSMVSAMVPNNEKSPKTSKSPRKSDNGTRKARRSISSTAALD